MKTTQNFNPDQQAIAVARHAADTYTGELNAVILFGSRARGDHRDQSDIDIMMVTDQNPTPQQQANLVNQADVATINNYETPPYPQVMWVTQEDCRRWSQTINHPIANALAEGFYITGDPDAYGPTDGQLEHLYTKELAQQMEETAQRATNGLSITDPATRADVVTHNAKATLTLAMRAVLSTHRCHYSTKATLAELAQMTNQCLPEANFYPQSDLQTLQTNVAENKTEAETQAIYDHMRADANHLYSLTTLALPRQQKKSRRRR